MPTRSVVLSADAVCVADTPWLNYSVTPVGVTADGSFPIAMIWWSPEAFANRDPSLPAANVNAILADGASRVDRVAYPAGWQNGDTIEGHILWPGAVIDESGRTVSWPGWMKDDDGTWVRSAEAPFYEISESAVVEIRINPASSEVHQYPPATPICNARPPMEQKPPVVPPKPASTPPDEELPATGTDAPGPLLAWGLAFLALGIPLAALRRRRPGGTTLRR